MVNGFPTVDSPKSTGKPSPEQHSSEIDVGNHLYSLYFKGLVSEDSLLAGFGVAILGQKDELVFQMKGPIHGSTITILEAELTALKRGLTEAADLGINHITIYCDDHPIHDIIRGRYVPKENNIALLITDVQRIRERFSSSFTIFLSRHSIIKHAYTLARETIVSEISIPVDPPRQAKPAPKMTCAICLDDDVNADQMFRVDKCHHKFCSQCAKRHIEVRLLEGSVVTCPQFRCRSILGLNRCSNLLTPKLRSIWQQRISENLIPFAERVYCPNPKCSALMRITQLSKLNKETEVRTCCVYCGESFCTNCKVPWHDNLSCDDYKTLHPNLTENDEKLHALANQKMWRQCRKCQHMIERSYGCVLVICRCGHKFCYQCGANAGSCTHGHGHRLPPPPPQLQSPPSSCERPCGFLLFLVLLLVAYYTVMIKYNLIEF